jgi:hypothetical protein
MPPAVSAIPFHRAWLNSAPICFPAVPAGRSPRPGVKFVTLIWSDTSPVPRQLAVATATNHRSPSTRTSP